MTDSYTVKLHFEDGSYYKGIVDHRDSILPQIQEMREDCNNTIFTEGLTNIVIEVMLDKLIMDIRCWVENVDLEVADWDWVLEPTAQRLRTLKVVGFTIKALN